MARWAMGAVTGRRSSRGVGPRWCMQPKGEDEQLQYAAWLVHEALQRRLIDAGSYDRIMLLVNERRQRIHAAESVAVDVSPPAPSPDVRASGQMAPGQAVGPPPGVTATPTASAAPSAVSPPLTPPQPPIPPSQPWTQSPGTRPPAWRVPVQAVASPKRAASGAAAGAGTGEASAALSAAAGSSPVARSARLGPGRIRIGLPRRAVAIRRTVWIHPLLV